MVKRMLNLMKYNVYNKDGKIIDKVNKKDEMNLNSDRWLKAVTCFVLNEKGEVLIEKRVNKGINPGQLDLCSGHVDINETQTQAMIRELGEELGIGLEEAMNVVKVSQDDLKFQIESSGKILNFLGTMYCLKRNSSEVSIQKEEIEKIVWLPLEETFELIKSGRTRFPKNFNYEQIFQNVRNIQTGKNKLSDRKVEK